MTTVAQNKTLLSCSLDLPDDFRVDDILAFHRRDPLSVAERVNGQMLQKGLAWGDYAACLTIRFEKQRAAVELAIDGPAATTAADTLQHMARRVLGLTQRIEDFEQSYRQHPQLGILIARQPGLRVPLAATPFEALTWAVTGQQISVGAAVAIRRKLILAAGLQHSGGLACYPGARQINGLSVTALRQAGYSQTKAQTLLTLSELIQQNRLLLDAWLQAEPPVDEIRAQLSKIRGIGPWTINYALLRGFGWLDGSLHGDAGVRRGLQALLREPEKIDEARAQQWLAPFSPWRALIAAHLWAFEQLQA